MPKFTPFASFHPVCQHCSRPADEHGAAGWCPGLCRVCGQDEFVCGGQQDETVTSELHALATGVRPLGTAALAYDDATQRGSIRVTEPEAQQHYFTPAEKAAREQRVLKLLAIGRH